MSLSSSLAFMLLSCLLMSHLLRAAAVFAITLFGPLPQAALLSDGSSRRQMLSEQGRRLLQRRKRFMRALIDDTRIRPK